MKPIPYDIGRVARSVQGHDRGKLFIIVKVVDERYVLICDGETRKLINPKKKQVKHLRALPVRSGLEEELRQGVPIQDAALRKRLKDIRSADDPPRDGPEGRQGRDFIPKPSTRREGSA